MKQKENGFFKNTIKVIVSNFALLSSSILVGLILPKILGVEQYGYYKLFMLYNVYGALLHFGFVDGILLYFGGKDYTKINKVKFRSITRFFIYFELIVSTILVICSLFISNDIYRFAFVAVGIYSFILNTFTYFQYFTQAIMNFDFLSKVNIFQALSTSIIILTLLFLIKLKWINDVNYKQYIYCFIVTYLIILIIYIFKYHALIFGEVVSLVRVKELIIFLFKIGFPVTISYQISNLILNLDNQYISIFFSNRTFGEYSFAYSLISLTTTVITAISTVIFPYLNKENKTNALKNYSSNVSYILGLIYFLIIVYFPVQIFVRVILPEYVASLGFFRILLPGVGITSCISLIIFNYFKITNNSIKYLILGIAVLVFAIVFNYLAYIIFKNPYAIAISSIIVLFLWYLLGNAYFHWKYKILKDKNTLYILLMTLTFELVTLVRNTIVSLVLYMIVYFTITKLLENKVINYIKEKLGILN